MFLADTQNAAMRQLAHIFVDLDADPDTNPEADLNAPPAAVGCCSANPGWVVVSSCSLRCPLTSLLCGDQPRRAVRKR